MRDYLKKDERIQLLYLKKYIDNIEKVLEWQGNLTKEEIKNLKTAKTLGLKAFNSIVDRQNTATIKTFWNSLATSYIQVVDKFSVDTYKKKLKSELDASYEENEDYFRLVELIMERNCKNCSCHGAECEIYQEFELHCVPSPIGEIKDNCKYSYDFIPQAATKLTPKELADKTVKDLTKRKIAKAKKAEADVMHHFTETKQKLRGKKIGQH